MIPPLNGAVLFFLLLAAFWIIFAVTPLGRAVDWIVGWMAAPRLERRRELWTEEEREGFRRYRKYLEQHQGEGQGDANA